MLAWRDAYNRQIYCNLKQKGALSNASYEIGGRNARKSIRKHLDSHCR